MTLHILLGHNRQYEFLLVVVGTVIKTVIVMYRHAQVPVDITEGH